jgi:hypothetical protein
MSASRKPAAPDSSTDLVALDAIGNDIRAAAADLVGNAIRIGHLLAEAKAMLPHGEWLPWLEREVPFLTRQRAADWMRLAAADPTLLEGATGITAAIEAVAGPERGPRSSNVTSDYISPGDFRSADHPLAAVFPDMRPHVFASLKWSLTRHGLLSPITVYEGMILDGRQRARACRELGIYPTTTATAVPAVKVFEGDERAAKQYLYAVNLQRRHRTDDEVREARAAYAEAFTKLGLTPDEVAEHMGPDFEPAESAD